MGTFSVSLRYSVIVFYQAIILGRRAVAVSRMDDAALIHKKVSITGLAELSWTRGHSVPSYVPACFRLTSTVGKLITELGKMGGVLRQTKSQRNLDTLARSELELWRDGRACLDFRLTIDGSTSSASGGINGRGATPLQAP